MKLHVSTAPTPGRLLGARLPLRDDPSSFPHQGGLAAGPRGLAGPREARAPTRHLGTPGARVQQAPRDHHPCVCPPRAVSPLRPSHRRSPAVGHIMPRTVSPAFGRPGQGGFMPRGPPELCDQPVRVGLLLLQRPEGQAGRGGRPWLCSLPCHTRSQSSRARGSPRLVGGRRRPGTGLSAVTLWSAQVPCG